jgi:hypothetical protein
MAKPEHLGYAAAALLLSLLLHLLLVMGLTVWAPPGWLRVLRPEFPRPPARVAVKPLRVRMFEVRDAVFRREPAVTVPPPPEQVLKMLEQLRLVAPPPPKAALAGLGANVVAPKSPVAAPEAPALAPPVKILEIAAATLGPERITEDRPRTPLIPRQELLGPLAPGFTGTGGGIGGGGGDTVGLAMRLAGLPPAPLRPEDLAALRERPPELTGGPGGLLLPLGAPPERLEGFVTVTLHVRQEPDGSGFFRIDIAPNPATAHLGTVAKDVLFLLDCSASIGAVKLGHFKEGLSQILQRLGPADRFNVVSFRDRSQPLFPELAPVTPAAVGRALEFVRRQRSIGLTDVYRTLEPWVKSEAGAGGPRPLNVFLISDGKSTVRNKLANDELIRQVVKLRRPHVSVYSFSAGKGANLFLMDLLAYSNRGMSLFVEKEPRFAAELGEFVRTHSDIIVADPRWQAIGGLGAEMFPKQLPHLYREEVLSVYGRYAPGTSDVALQVIGRDAAGRAQELVWRGDLRTAAPAGPELPKVWASQKVYHLLAERVLHPARAAALEAELRELAKRFGLPIPYL